MGPSAGLDRCGKFLPDWIRSSDRPARSQYVTINSTVTVAVQKYSGLTYFTVISLRGTAWAAGSTI